MKMLFKLEYFDKSIFLGFAGYYMKRVKYTLKSATPTMFINVADKDNKNGRIFYRDGICNAYCRACDNLMVLAPKVLYNLESGHKIVCPMCGHTHTLEHCMTAYIEDYLFPLLLKVKLVQMKNDNLELILNYTALKLGKDSYNDFDEGFNVNEKYVFNCVDKSVTWYKTCGDKTECIELGYFEDLDDFKEKTALSKIPYNLFDNKGNKVSMLFKILRDKINESFMKQGVSKRDLYITGERGKIVLDSILYMAHKVRFWDCGDYKFLYATDRNTYHNWKYHSGLQNVRADEKKIYEYMKKGESYANAFIKYFNLPDVKLVRKNIAIEKARYLIQAYSLKDVDTGNMFYSYLREKRINYEDVKTYYAEIAKYYPHIKNSTVLNYFMNNNESHDTIALWKMLDESSRKKFEQEKVRFRDLHDYLSYLSVLQRDRDCVIDVPQEVINRFEIEINNTKCEVLRKYSNVRKVAMSLNNCALRYVNEINENLQLVAMTNSKGKTIALLRIEKGVIKEAKLCNNRPIKDNKQYLQIFNKFVEKTKLKVDTRDAVPEVEYKAVRIA